MNPNVTIQNAAQVSPSELGWRPISRQVIQDGELVTQFRVNQQTGRVMVQNADGLIANSLLRKDEWQDLTQAVYTAARLRRNIVADLKASGLIYPIASYGTLTTQWNVSSEMTAASVNMTGEAQQERARVDNLLRGVPVPIVAKEFAIPRRQLEASRLMQNPLDTTHAIEAAEVVAEQLEGIALNGASITFDGNTLNGLVNHTDTNTDTATNYGGGDFGTIANVVPTIEGMISALSTSTNRRHGPFNLYIAPVQYNQTSLSYYTDGSGQTPLQRILQMPQISAAKANDQLSDGQVLLTQMTANVVEWAEHMDIEVMEWQSNDGQTAFFKVVSVATIRVKSDHSGRTGVAVATGA